MAGENRTRGSLTDRVRQRGSQAAPARTGNPRPPASPAPRPAARPPAAGGPKVLSQGGSLLRYQTTTTPVPPAALTPKARAAKLATNAMSLKTANSCVDGYLGGGGAGSWGGGIMQGNASNIYSPHLSTDFLELPQNLTEKRAYYRHFYNYDPYVGRAIDLHTEVPLGKIMLTAPPEGKDPRLNQEICKFFEDMFQRLGLLKVLVEATREYYIIGDSFIFAEDGEVEIPEDLLTEEINYLDPERGPVRKRVPIEDPVRREQLEQAYAREHYQGWSKLVHLPPEQVNVEAYGFTTEAFYELMGDEKTKELIRRAEEEGDARAAEIVKSIPEDLVKFIQEGKNLPLDTDPYTGSFVHHLARNKPSFQTYGVSLLERCLKTLVHRDKLRQSQASIASRSMTPKRLVYAEDLNTMQLEELRMQVDALLLDPDYTMITNYQVNWEELSARDRLLDLGSEYDITDRQLFAGLIVTESMLTGESAYSGERINVEIINQLYLSFRDEIQNYVEQKLMKPVAERKGFIQKDPSTGKTVVLYPRLRFARLGLRDNRDVYDALFNLYQKGSLSVDVILELYNLDPTAVKDKVERDMFSVNDPVFNEMIRGFYSEMGRYLAEKTDLPQRMMRYVGATPIPAEEGDDDGRF